MTDMITAEEAEKLLDGTTPGLTDHCLYHCGKRVAECPCMRDLAAKHALATAAPDLARTVIALHAQLADAQARGMEMALKTYRTGAGVDNGNYPLWAYDADYETAVRKKAEVHRKAASDRATRKGI